MNGAAASHLNLDSQLQFQSLRRSLASWSMEKKEMSDCSVHLDRLAMVGLCMAQGCILVGEEYLKK